MTGLYSVNLHVMGSSNIPLIDVKTLATYAEQLGASASSAARRNLNVAGWAVSVRDISMLIWHSPVRRRRLLLLYLFFRTDMGTAMRATGDNP